MTRFARAKGSKASNERVPDEATPWHVMKQQLESNKMKDDAKNKSAKELLNADEPSSCINTDWAEFENQPSQKKFKNNRNNDNSEVKHKNSNLAKNIKHSTQIGEPEKDYEVIGNELEGPDFQKNRKRKNTKNIDVTNSVENKNEETFVVMSKRQKRNLKHKSKSSNNDDSPTKNMNLVGKNLKSHNTIKQQNNMRKLPKIKDLKEYKRRKPDIGETSMTINGVEVQITKYDGFPVKKEDAERLKELKQKMIMKGIPKSEINFAMKLERRKAEKALARLKKCVCFHCRKSGHNLSDCPELGREQHATGICYKCGSTEHAHFECKVNKSTEFRFATCFICREQGHISKQCPDNPRGVYPDGGCCKICGDVTHLKKDCPDLIKAKEESTLTVDTIDDSKLECL